MSKLICAVGGLFFMSNSCFALDLATTIAESVKNSKIMNVSLETIPNDDSLILVINTSAGTRNIIVTRENIPVALAALRNPQVTGNDNAVKSSDIIEHGPLIAYTIPPQPRPMLASNPTVPNPEVVNPAMEEQEPTMMPESAPSEVAATIASANQQASR